MLFLFVCLLSPWVPLPNKTEARRSSDNYNWKFLIFPATSTTLYIISEFHCVSNFTIIILEVLSYQFTHISDRAKVLADHLKMHEFCFHIGPWGFCYDIYITEQSEPGHHPCLFPEGGFCLFVFFRCSSSISPENCFCSLPPACLPYCLPVPTLLVM